MTRTAVLARLQAELDNWLPERHWHGDVTHDEIVMLADTLDAACEECGDAIDDAELEEEDANVRSGRTH